MGTGRLTEPCKSTGSRSADAPPMRAGLWRWIAGNPVITALLLVCSLIELILILADFGIIGTTRWRATAYQNAGFWVGLLDNWRPNYGAQPYLMFLTYAFLHGGFWHLALNMVTLVSLGTPLSERLGQWRFGLLYLASMLGGAAGFALLTDKMQPMVGASGALFGLAGALLADAFFDFRRAGSGLSAAMVALSRPIAGLVLLNVLIYWATGGQLAWETHLGGFLVGAVAAIFLDRDPEGPDPSA